MCRGALKQSTAHGAVACMAGPLCEYSKSGMAPRGETRQQRTVSTSDANESSIKSL
ncbi:hypothetical protein F444_04279 [Phytophthora nicotianae P1976]|uniref:Uncharacterized protein n=1 Tax=Phytophthora nicotianae P1976 TaxID=1317066 RepID=A0A081AR93_PHYNI|nr:hypothetical protein F444_04279 [Phytophthora nicotianae P1976]